MTLPTMEALKHFQSLNFGEWHIKHDRDSQLTAIIAIHNTHNGPALGGCRFIPYDTFDQALIDAARLAHSMSLKAAISKLPFGGGKAVIMRPPEPFDRQALFKAFGAFVQELGGRYITAEDSGTTVDDMDNIHATTQFVTGCSMYTTQHKDPSPLTALGVRRAMESASQFHLDKPISDCHIAIKGVGNVGYHLAKECAQLGAQLSIADIDTNRCQQIAKEFNTKIINTEEIHALPCDIYAPCALSNAVTNDNIHQLQCKIIAGAANNQLEDDALAKTLAKQNILYLPDFMINAGGLIHVAGQFNGESEQQTDTKVSQIYNTTQTILSRALKENNLPLTIAADTAQSYIHR